MINRRGEREKRNEEGREGREGFKYTLRLLILQLGEGAWEARQI